MIFGMWNPEKIAHEQLIYFLTSPIRVLFWDTLCRPKPYTVVSKLKATGKCNSMVHKVRRGRCWYLVCRQTAREWCKSCTYVDSRRRCQYSPHTPSESRLPSQPLRIIAFWPVIIAPTHGGIARLSWPGWHGYIPRWITRPEDDQPSKD